MLHLEQLDELPDTADELRALAAAFGDSARVMLTTRRHRTGRTPFWSSMTIGSWLRHSWVGQGGNHGGVRASLPLTPSDSLSPMDDKY